MPSDRPPNARTSSITVGAESVSLNSRAASRLMSLMTTSAPRPARRRASARPTPRALPVPHPPFPRSFTDASPCRLRTLFLSCRRLRGHALQVCDRSLELLNLVGPQHVRGRLAIVRDPVIFIGTTRVGYDHAQRVQQIGDAPHRVVCPPGLLQQLHVPGLARPQFYARRKLGLVGK